MMKSADLRKLFSLLLIIAVFFLSCGDENPQGPEDEDIVTVDTIPPAAVTDLTLRSVTSSSVALVWIAPGDDGTTGQATAYDIRYATSEITDQTWESAVQVAGPPPPKPAGQLETVVVPGLQSVTQYYFALKTSDEVPNRSILSNSPDTTTLQEYTAPAPVTDLAGVTLSGSELLLTWTASGDDGKNGTATYYDIRYSYSPINDQNWDGAIRLTGEPEPNPGGEPDSFLITGTSPDSSFYFGLKTGDEVPNWSLLSNTPLILGHYVQLEAVPELVRSEPEMLIYFKAATSKVSITIWRYNPYGNDSLFRSLVSDYYPTGAHVVAWDLLGDGGASPSIGWNYRIELRWGNTLIAEKLIRFV